MTLETNQRQFRQNETFAFPKLAIIGLDGFAMVFGLTTIGVDGFFTGTYAVASLAIFCVEFLQMCT